MLTLFFINFVAAFIVLKFVSKDTVVIKKLNMTVSVLLAICFLIGFLGPGFCQYAMAISNSEVCAYTQGEPEAIYYDATSDEYFVVKTEPWDLRNIYYRETIRHDLAEIYVQQYEKATPLLQGG